MIACVRVCPEATITNEDKMDGMSMWSTLDTNCNAMHTGTDDDGGVGQCYNDSKVTVSFCANAITAEAVEQLVVKESDCQMQLMTKPSEVAVVVE